MGLAEDICLPIIHFYHAWIFSRTSVFSDNAWDSDGFPNFIFIWYFFQFEHAGLLLLQAKRKEVIMLNSAISLFLLRELPFSRFDFPRWKAVVAISFIGMLVGLDPNFRTPPPGLTDVPLPPLWMALMLGLVLVWVSFVIIVGVMRWWLKRGGRWDGQGNLFNLIASSWLVSNVLGAGLTALGVWPLFTLPLWLYAIWVGAQAMESAIPKASLGYCIAGIIIGLVPAMLANGLVFGLLGVVLAVV